jgi:hypothetical protein
MIIFSSCDKKRVFDEYKSVGSAWHKDSITPSIYIGLYKTLWFVYNVRDNNDYQFNNLFLIVALELQMDLQKRYTWIPNGRRQAHY